MYLRNENESYLSVKASTRFPDREVFSLALTMPQHVIYRPESEEIAFLYTFASLVKILEFRLTSRVKSSR